MNRSADTVSSIVQTSVLLLLITVGSAFSRAQYGGDPENRSSQPSYTEEQSRAEREADEVVSLSADKIITLLRDEPGLLLRAKRLLVMKAYEQGRLLDPDDLTDDALFRLLRDDQHTRVLITREIERRYYVRARPTREELRQGLVATTSRSADKPPSQETQPRTRSQEESYWAQHDSTLEAGPQPQGGQNAVQRSGPSLSYEPRQSTRDQEPPQPSRPVINRTHAQPLDDPDFNWELPEFVAGDAIEMPRIQPEQMPSLLSASITDNSFPERERRGSYVSGRSGMSDPSVSQTSPRAGSPVDFPSRMPDQIQASRGRFSPLGPALESSRPERRPDQQGLRHRANPYADVPSLYDLYSQYSSRPSQLRRFGGEIFQNGTGNFEELPMDMPVGPDYVLGPGDGLKVELWGGVSERLQRVVDREGRIALPEVGSLQVTGRSLGDVQRIVQSSLRTQFRDVQADVSLSRLRSVRVYVVGDVQRPGAYDVSSLSTPLNALYLAGGPTSRGSLRILQQYRGKQLIQQIDVYDLLLHGVRSGLQGLQSGDTVMVPPLGAEVMVEGMVRRPAIYELNGEKTLAEVLELAGGVLQSGTLRHVDVERVEAHLSRAMLRLDVPENNNQDSVTRALEDFKVQDGDKIKISPILPYADKTVYLDGHVFRPGKYAYQQGMKVSDLIKSYSEVLPEPYKKHAEIIRLNAPDYSPTVLAFNLDDALSGKDQNLTLKPFDTVRVFGRFDFEDAPAVTVSGEVRDPGDHVTNGVTYLRDAVYLAGGVTPDALLSDAQVFRKTEDGKLKVISIDLSQALAGVAADNILLQPKDRLIIHKNLGKVDPPTVRIEGEVARPGKYPLGDAMTAADLVKVAGGLKRGAYTEVADLTRYELQTGTSVTGEHLSVPLAQALAGAPDTAMRLHDGDVLTVRQLAGWRDMGATITVKGEVVHPGTYGIKEGERLSSILQRAGGLRGDAYPYGAVFQRAQVRELEEKNRAQLVSEVQEQGKALRQAPANDEDQKLAKQAALMQWQTTLERLQNTPPEGRLVIHISREVKRWANTPADIEVRAGDTIYIPKRPSLVMIDGAVYNPTAVSFKPGKSAGWYLRQAGGPTNSANKKALFVIRADGSVVGGSGGLFSGGAENATLQAGDMVVVPEKGFSANTRWKNILQASQLAYAVGIAIQVSRNF